MNGSDETEIRENLRGLLSETQRTQYDGDVTQGMSVTDVLLTMYLGPEMYEKLKSTPSTGGPSPSSDVAVAPIINAESQSDVTPVWNADQTKLYYIGKAYQIEVENDKYLTLTPANKDLAAKLERAWNESQPDKANHIAVANASVKCVMGNCLQLTFPTYTGVTTMDQVSKHFQSSKYDSNASVETLITVENDEFHFGNGGTFALHVMKEHEWTGSGYDRLSTTNMKVTPGGRDFADALVKAWNAQKANDPLKVLAASNKCGGIISDCEEIAFDRYFKWGSSTIDNIADVITKLKTETFNTDSVNTKLKTDTFADQPRRGTHDDLFNKFHVPTEPPPRVEYRASYDAGIGPLGNVLAQM